MTNAIEFRGEQAAMSSKHTDVVPTDFNEYIKKVTDKEPVESVEVTPEYLQQHADVEQLEKIFGEELVKKMTDNLKFGTLRSPDEITEAARRIQALVMDRVLANREHDHLVWFTFRRDGQFSYVDWPVASYMGVDRWDIWHQKGVDQALTRLKKNRTITHISVTGVKPKHWYHTAL